MTKTGRNEYTLLQDPDFLHLRLRDEVEWERQQGRDTKNPDLTAPVRARDGDVCRYCYKPVNFRARKGGRRGTYDHRNAGQAATIDTMVVACGACNSGRRDRENADDLYPLRPVPVRPWFDPTTVEWLATHGFVVESAEKPPVPVQVPARPIESVPDGATHDVLEDSARAGTDAAVGAHPGHRDVRERAVDSATDGLAGGHREESARAGTDAAVGAHPGVVVEPEMVPVADLPDSSLEYPGIPGRDGTGVVGPVAGLDGQNVGQVGQSGQDLPSARSRGTRGRRGRGD